MASKFSTPFMAKSPLYGAYESGAGGKVHVSNRQAFQKLFDDASSVGSSSVKQTACEKGAKTYTIDNATYNCPSKETNDVTESTKNTFSFSDKVDVSDLIKSPLGLLGECPKGKVRSKINKKCVSKKGAGKEYDK